MQSVSFSPALPTSKLAAIDRLGVAVINKVVLRFPTRFWEVSSEFNSKSHSPLSFMFCFVQENADWIGFNIAIDDKARYCSLIFLIRNFDLCLKALEVQRN